MGIGGHAAKYQLVDKNTRISNNNINASARTTNTWERKHNGKNKTVEKMFFSRNKCKKQQRYRHDQWPPQRRAGEETTKYKPTTKTNRSGRTLKHENNMHYPMWKETHLTKKKNIFGQKNMVFARASKFRPKTRTTPWQKKYNGGLRRANVWKRKKTQRERISKIDLGKRKLCHFQEMVWKHPFQPLGNIFSLKFQQRKMWKQIKEQAAKKWRKNRQRCSRNTRKRAKTEKNR